MAKTGKVMVKRRCAMDRQRLARVAPRQVAIAARQIVLQMYLSDPNVQVQGYINGGAPRVLHFRVQGHAATQQGDGRSTRSRDAIL
jgi:hypothetical protein